MANFLGRAQSLQTLPDPYIICRTESTFLPVKMADRLGEQLLTDVKPFLKVRLRFAKAFKFGVLQTVLL